MGNAMSDLTPETLRGFAQVCRDSVEEYRKRFPDGFEDWNELPTAKMGKALDACADAWEAAERGREYWKLEATRKDFRR